MLVTSTPMLVSDYIIALPNIIVNRDYQRAAGLWPKRAKSALIETVILGFPMPAMYLHQLYDPEAKRPYKELVDGQQRTEAIREFAEGKLRISTTVHTPRLRGRTLQTLDDSDHQAFLSYPLPVFVFTNSTPVEVREAFRRLNSFTTLLNPEEKRHSTFHGPFKWFVNELSSSVAELLIRWGTLTPALVNRMKDTAIVAEILYAYFNGIKTTKAQQLDQMYLVFDKQEEFEQGELVNARITEAFRVLGAFDWFTPSYLTKPYQLVPLVLAVMHARNAIPALSDVGRGGGGLKSGDEIRQRLAELVAALESSESGDDQGGDPVDDVEPSELDTEGQTFESASNGDGVDTRYEAYSEFISASREKTNTGDTRKVRFRTFLEAVSPV